MWGMNDMPGGYEGKSHKEIKAIKKAIAENNRRYTDNFVELPREEIGKPFPPERVWRNKRYLVSLYIDSINGHLRLSIQRTTINDDGTYEDGISWDKLQEIKSQVGFGDWWGLEVFPVDWHLVNVSNIRHIWLFRERPPFAWGNKVVNTRCGV